MKTKPAPDCSFLAGLAFSSWNGCREMDRAQMLANLKLAPLDDYSSFIQFLNSMGCNERIWWLAIGWPEGHGYFSRYSHNGQLGIMANLRKDRDERLAA